MDEYLSTPQGLRGTRDHDNMAPTSPGSASMAESTPDHQDMDALSQISADLAAISASMLTRKDKAEMVAELRSVIREEIEAVRSNLTALEHRVDDLEVDRMRQVEDLDNRARLNNIRVRGIPETEGDNPHGMLTSLFSQLLGDKAQSDFGIERAHRALRAPVGTDYPGM
ncbi:Hypothetical predicted protein [Pelobates cultripes]|uniref:Uncharacterized protein n=1 Tax=Pelobates cultripes TaxID=61616 RepID=A0AAD1S6Y2_PELCU|nr:Hypothetical predicted protein [Pelobates cultripes]